MQEQLDFWKNRYAKSYREKNSAFNVELGVEGWEIMLKGIDGMNNILECGSNIGRNIGFLEKIYPNVEKTIIELSPDAFEIVTQKYPVINSFNGPILESNYRKGSFSLVFTIGVLIHINPNDLLDTMQRMYDYSNEYILIGEYFNRTPVMIEYQGEQNKLFKRDFGKMFIDNFNVELVDYGFLWGYIYDSAGFDDITYWLFKKK